MNKNILAINGGLKTITRPFKKYITLDEREVDAVSEVIRSGNLSSFFANKNGFLGGKKVNEFERACESYFGVKHAITVNSWTSGLVAAVGALETEPGDEIITTPWSMCATATAILQWNAIPVFADIEDNTFNIDPDEIIKKITNKTKAIIAVDIFGHSANIKELRKIADEYNLKLISDSAQAPAATYHGEYAGTLADIGGFSLNYHKHIHTGEGGILVTNDDRLAKKLRLIRNHGEAVIDKEDIDKENQRLLVNMLGHNFRMGEIEAAIGLVQLSKLNANVKSRQVAAKNLTLGLKNLPGLITPITEKNCSHSFYVYAIKIDQNILKVPRSRIIKALESEGVPGIMEGYTNLHLLPLYQNKIAYGSSGFPWNSPYNDNHHDYTKGICPIAENLHDKNLIGLQICMHEFDKEEVDLVIKSFKKVWSALDTL